MSQIQILQWLIANRDVLTKAVEIAKKFSRHTPYLEQWGVVDQLARLLIPAFFKGDVAPQAVDEDDDVKFYGPAYDAKMLALGAEIGALGIDWKTVIDTLLPVIMAVLDLIAKMQKDK